MLELAILVLRVSYRRQEHAASFQRQQASCHIGDSQRLREPRVVRGACFTGIFVKHLDFLYLILILAVPQVQAAPSGKEEAPDAQLIDAELQGAYDGTQSMGLLGRHATSIANAANNAPAGLAVADDFQTSYLQPLKIFDTAIEKIANVRAALLSW